MADLYTIINLLTAVMLGGAYDGGGASPIGLQDHTICCNGRYRLAAAAAAYAILLKAEVALG